MEHFSEEIKGQCSKAYRLALFNIYPLYATCSSLVSVRPASFACSVKVFLNTNKVSLTTKQFVI